VTESWLTHWCYRLPHWHQEEIILLSLITDKNVWASKWLGILWMNHPGPVLPWPSNMTRALTSIILSLPHFLSSLSCFNLTLHLWSFNLLFTDVFWYVAYFPLKEYNSHEGRDCVLFPMPKTVCGTNNYLLNEWTIWSSVRRQWKLKKRTVINYCCRKISCQ
jgi:hypothetical protein